MAMRTEGVFQNEGCVTYEVLDKADEESVMGAVNHFKYPQPEIVKDFSTAFEHMSESIYFTFERDPYPTDEQPYVGQLKVNITIDESLPVEPDHELFVLLCTESLFDGYNYKPENWKYFSRYVFLSPDTQTYTFKNVHPGEYFIYSYNDINGDRHHLAGGLYELRMEPFYYCSSGKNGYGGYEDRFCDKYSEVMRTFSQYKEVDTVTGGSTCRQTRH